MLRRPTLVEARLAAEDLMEFRTLNTHMMGLWLHPIPWFDVADKRAEMRTIHFEPRDRRMPGHCMIEPEIHEMIDFIWQARVPYLVASWRNQRDGLCGVLLNGDHTVCESLSDSTSEPMIERMKAALQWWPSSTDEIDAMPQVSEAQAFEVVEKLFPAVGEVRKECGGLHPPTLFGIGMAERVCGLVRERLVTFGDFQGEKFEGPCLMPPQPGGTPPKVIGAGADWLVHVCGGHIQRVDTAQQVGTTVAALKAGMLLEECPGTVEGIMVQLVNVHGDPVAAWQALVKGEELQPFQQLKLCKPAPGLEQSATITGVAPTVH